VLDVWQRQQGPQQRHLQPLAPDPEGEAFEQAIEPENLLKACAVA
jgi:hypothetical protein